MPYDRDTFIHLHGHSHYSLLDGGATVEGLIKRTKELGMPAIALTDHGNLFGAVEWYQTGKKFDVKAIVGCEFYVAPGDRREKEAHGISEAAYHLPVVVKNLQGWKNILKLASLAYTEGFYYRPRVDKETLAKYREGLVVMNGHLGTEIASCLEHGNFEAAVAAAAQYKDIFGDDFYVELQNHGDQLQVSMLPKLLEVAKRVGAKVLATNDHHYLMKDDYDAHDALCCISMGRTINDETRLKYSRELYLKSPQEMREIFKDIPEACDSTIEVAEKCDLKLDFNARHAPVYAPPPKADGKTAHPDEYLRELCIEGLKEKFGEDIATRDPAYYKRLMERMDFELQVICSKGFSSYFLIVWDFCNFAKQNGIPVGARGSGVGTLVGYVLSLCNVDPIKYDLLFERFMDPARAAMPDIDIDICQEGRGKVIEYVRKKYGNVCQIITFNTLGAKAAIKDVGRVLGMSLPDVDKISKLIPGGPGVVLEDVVKIPDIQRLKQESAQVEKLFDTAMRLEGLCRNAGMHAAGVIVCDKPLDEIVPLYKNGDDIMTQWDGPTCEMVGLLKMDFLGLRTLTILERALDLIEQDYARGEIKKHPYGIEPPFRKDRPQRIDIEKIDITDQRVYKQIFQPGCTKGVFQFESGGMKDLLIKMKPDRLEDLIAANALYRPGPMDLIPDYCARKHGRQQVPSLHPQADDVLKETYGVMVYQEQVMRIFNRLGNIPLRRAYDIIKAISKKKAEVINKEKVSFIEGCVANGLSKEQANEIFVDIEKFAGYGFNKSHSTRYAFVAYQTAWLKTYYPLQYMAALLTFEMVDQAKVVEYIDECRHLTLPSGKVGIEILPPEINQSDADFTVVGETIRFGLAAVKGVGEKAVESIVAARKATEEKPAAPFKSIFDFCERVDLRVVNKGVVEALIKCGAFDEMHPVRAASMAGAENAIRMGQVSQEAKRSGQDNLFGGGGSGTAAVAAIEPRLPAVPEWPKSERMALEKSVLGFYVTNHPLRDVENVFTSYITLDTQTIRGAADRSNGMLGGLVSKVRMMMTKTGPNAGKKWCILAIEDLVGTIEVVLYSAQYEKFAPIIKADAVLIFEGAVDRSREEPSFKATEVMTLEQAQKRKTREILVQTSSVQLDEGTLEKLKAALVQHKGATPVKLELLDLAVGQPVRVEVKIGGGINMQNGGVAALQGIFGENNVMPLGPNRRSARRAPVVAETQLIAPSDDPELAEAA